MNGYAGFDRSDYPGDAIMNWLRQNTNLRWCGFYLAPAPSHPGVSWMQVGAAKLRDMNWGLAPIYVGRQVYGPGSHTVSDGTGSNDGLDAALLLRRAGFDTGAKVYLDLENGPPLYPQQVEYITEWCKTVRAGGYQPGVYCSFLMADNVHNVDPDASLWAFHVRTVNTHFVPGTRFPNPDPETSGYTGASIWQLDDSALVAVPGFAEVIMDLNSADSPDPSR